jgi:hypothetical protein
LDQSQTPSEVRFGIVVRLMPFQPVAHASFTGDEPHKAGGERRRRANARQPAAPVPFDALSSVKVILGPDPPAPAPTAGP